MPPKVLSLFREGSYQRTNKIFCKVQKTCNPTGMNCPSVTIYLSVSSKKYFYIFQLTLTCSSICSLIILIINQIVTRHFYGKKPTNKTPPSMVGWGVLDAMQQILLLGWSSGDCLELLLYLQILILNGSHSCSLGIRTISCEIP